MWVGSERMLVELESYYLGSCRLIGLEQKIACVGRAHMFEVCCYSVHPSDRSPDSTGIADRCWTGMGWWLLLKTWSQGSIQLWSGRIVVQVCIVYSQRRECEIDVRESKKADCDRFNYRWHGVTMSTAHWTAITALQKCEAAQRR